MGEPLEGRLAAQNIDKPVFDTDVRGTVDLTKLTKIFPLEGMTVTGRLNGNIAAKGNMADIEAEPLPERGGHRHRERQNVTYKSKDLPQGVKMTRATATFNNDKIVLQRHERLCRQLRYCRLGHHQQLPGLPVYAGPAPERQHDREHAQLQCERVDGGRGIGQAHRHRPKATRPPKAQGVLQIPKYFDLILNSNVEHVMYDNLKLDDVKGTVVVRDETVHARWAEL